MGHLVQSSFKIYLLFPEEKNRIKVGFDSRINQIIVPVFLPHLLEQLSITYSILGPLNPNSKFPMTFNPKKKSLEKQIIDLNWFFFSIECQELIWPSFSWVRPNWWVFLGGPPGEIPSVCLLKVPLHCLLSFLKRKRDLQMWKHLKA